MSSPSRFLWLSPNTRISPLPVTSLLSYLAPSRWEWREAWPRLCRQRLSWTLRGELWRQNLTRVGVFRGTMGCTGPTYRKHWLHLHHGQIPVGVLQFLLVLLNLPLLAPVQVGGLPVSLLLLLQLLGLFLYLCLQFLVFLSSVDEDPGDALPGSCFSITKLIISLSVSLTSPSKAVQMEMTRIRIVSAHISQLRCLLWNRKLLKPLLWPPVQSFMWWQCC